MFEWIATPITTSGRSVRARSANFRGVPNDRIREFAGDRLDQALFNADKASRLDATATLKKEVVAHFVEAARSAGEREETSDFRDGLAADYVTDTVLKSAASRRWETVPLV